jgi:glycosyltransferase involved in cell wall biosynthesis
MEVIIADDGSREQTRCLIEKLTRDFPVPIVHCWQPDEGFRLAQIRNKAIAAAKGEYIIVIDGDMLLDKEFVRGHQRAAWKGQFVQGSRVWLSEEGAAAMVNAKNIMAMPPLWKRGNAIQSIRSRFLSKLFSKYTDQLEGVKGCNIAFWKTDCVAVNGFNEEFRSWGREDSEFAARLMNAGIKRLNLRFAGIAYHLSHEEASRPQMELNDKLLQRTVTEKLKYCDNGIAKERQSSELGL